jgi:predicted XRE-type DNA-binding protein
MKIKYKTSSSGSWLKGLYEKRKEQNRDLAILISDAQNERGTGKTTLALKLAEYLDRTEEGLTEEKAFHNPEKLEDAYTEKPKGSSLLLDEAETGLSKYRASSSVNKAIRDVISQGRIEEKYAVFSLPASGVLDTDLKSLFDVWILVQRRGKGMVHYCNYNPYGQHPLYSKKENIEWKDLDVIPWKVEDVVEVHNRLSSVYEHLTEDKKRNLRGEEKNEEEEEVPEEVRKEARNKVIQELYENSDMTQREVANSVGLSRSHVANLLAE